MFETIASVIAIIAGIIGAYYLIILSVSIGGILFSCRQDDISRLRFDLLSMELKGRFTYYPALIIIVGVPLMEHLINSTGYSLFIVLLAIFYFICLQIKRSEKRLMLEIKSCEDTSNKVERWYLILQTENDEYIFSKYIPRHKEKGLMYNKPNLKEIKLYDLKNVSKQELINSAYKYVYMTEIPQKIE